MNNINEKFEKAFNHYLQNQDDESWNIMVRMFNQLEITPDEYQERYECLFPQMGDSTLFEDVDIDEFLGKKEDFKNEI